MTGWTFGPPFRFISGGMGTKDYMHRTGVRYRHSIGKPQELEHMGTPAPADVMDEWAEFQRNEQAEYVAWCKQRNITP